MVNFGEIRRAQLAKSTLLTSTLVPLGSFSDLLRSVQMIKRELGAENNVTPEFYETAIRILVSQWGQVPQQPGPILLTYRYWFLFIGLRIVPFLNAPHKHLDIVVYKELQFTIHPNQ